MKAVLVQAPLAVEVVDMPKPEITAADDVLIKVRYGGICGSDIGIFSGSNSFATYPRIIGHEFAGIVEAVGSGVDDLAPGDLVSVDIVNSCGHCYACRTGHHNVCKDLEVTGVHRDGGFAEYVRIPASAVRAGNVNFIPDEVDYLAASLSEPLACVINGQEAMDIQLGDTVAVIGAGPIGIMHAELARARGAGKIFLLNRSRNRLDAAQDLNYDAYIETGEDGGVQAVLDATDGLGANVVIVTAGSAAAQRAGIAMTGKMGKVCLFAGLPKDTPELSFDVNFVHYRQITLYGTFSSAPRHNALAVELIRSGKINADRILTHAVALEDIVHGFDLVEHRAGMRIAVLPDMEEMGALLARYPHMSV